MKLWGLSLLLLASFAAAQTGTFSVGSAQCYPAQPLAASVECYGAPLYNNGAFAGYVTFQLNQTNGTVTSGFVVRYNTSDAQTGQSLNVIGNTDAVNQVFNFTFSGGLSGAAGIGYTIYPAHKCGRINCPQRLYTSSGIITFN